MRPTTRQPDAQVEDSTVSQGSAHAVRNQRPAGATAPRTADIDNRHSNGWPATAEDVLTVNEVAALFKLSPRTVSEYGAKGVLPSVKIGRHRRFSRPQLEAVMASGRGAESKPATRGSRGSSTV
jgi:excisionase family DNA binding protein